jgi:hypothetical protein
MGRNWDQILFLDDCNRRTTQALASPSFPAVKDSWIPASAGMTQDFWIPYSPGIRSAKSQGMTKVIIFSVYQ